MMPYSEAAEQQAAPAELSHAQALDVLADARRAYARAHPTQFDAAWQLFDQAVAVVTGGQG